MSNYDRLVIEVEVTDFNADGVLEGLAEWEGTVLDREGGPVTRPFEYTCDSCRQTFVDDEPELAAVEAEETFTPEELADVAVVCDDCWNAMRVAMPDFDARYAR